MNKSVKWLDIIVVVVAVFLFGILSPLLGVLWGGILAVAIAGGGGFYFNGKYDRENRANREENAER